VPAGWHPLPPRRAPGALLAPRGRRSRHRPRPHASRAHHVKAENATCDSLTSLTLSIRGAFQRLLRWSLERAGFKSGPCRRRRGMCARRARSSNPAAAAATGHRARGHSNDPISCLRRIRTVPRLHALQPEVVPHTLRTLGYGTVVAEEGPVGEIAVELCSVGDRRGADPVEGFDRQAAWVVVRLQYQGRDRGDQHGAGDTLGAVATDVACDFATSGREPARGPCTRTGHTSSPLRSIRIVIRSVCRRRTVAVLSLVIGRLELMYRTRARHRRAARARALSWRPSVASPGSRDATRSPTVSTTHLIRTRSATLG
jgi:hypothetical protein